MTYRRRRPSLKSRAKKLLGWACIVAMVAVNIYPPIFGLVMDTLLAALRGRFW